MKGLGKTRVDPRFQRFEIANPGGVDSRIPVFDDIRVHFGLADDATDVAQIVTLYLLGMASGQIFYGPFADRDGRRAGAVRGSRYLCHRGKT